VGQNKWPLTIEIKQALMSQMLEEIAQIVDISAEE